MVSDDEGDLMAAGPSESNFPNKDPQWGFFPGRLWGRVALSRLCSAGLRINARWRLVLQAPLGSEVGMGCGVSTKVVPGPPLLPRVKQEGQGCANSRGVGPGPEAAAEAARRMQVARVRARFDPRVLAR